MGSCTAVGFGLFDFNSCARALLRQCGIGTYSPSLGQLVFSKLLLMKLFCPGYTACATCPSSATTASTGSTALTQCLCVSSSRLLAHSALCFAAESRILWAKCDVLSSCKGSECFLACRAALAQLARLTATPTRLDLPHAALVLQTRFHVRQVVERVSNACAQRLAVPTTRPVSATLPTREFCLQCFILSIARVVAEDRMEVIGLQFTLVLQFRFFRSMHGVCG